MSGGCSGRLRFDEERHSDRVDTPCDSIRCVRDVVCAEVASTDHTGSAPQAMAALRNLAIGRLWLLGADNVAKTTRAIRDAPEHAVWIWGITDSPLLPGT